MPAVTRSFSWFLPSHAPVNHLPNHQILTKNAFLHWMTKIHNPMLIDLHSDGIHCTEYVPYIHVRSTIFVIPRLPSGPL